MSFRLSVRHKLLEHSIFIFLAQISAFFRQYFIRQTEPEISRLVVIISLNQTIRYWNIINIKIYISASLLSMLCSSSIMKSSSLWKYPDCRLTAANREIENSRVPHQVLTAQSVLRFRELQTSSIREIISHDQQKLCKRVCLALKTVPIEHNFVRLTKEQVSSGAVVASL